MSDTTHDSEPGWSDWSNSARREIAALRDTVAFERARRAEHLSAIADTLAKMSEDVRQMAREG